MMSKCHRCGVLVNRKRKDSVFCATCLQDLYEEQTKKQGGNTVNET